MVGLDAVGGVLVGVVKRDSPLLRARLLHAHSAIAVDECGSEVLDRAVDGDVIDFDPAFDQDFFGVAVGQSFAEVPTHGEHDHFGREPVPGGRGAVHEWR